MFTQHAIIWVNLQSYLDSYHTYAGLTMLVYIYTAMLYGAMTRHHSDQHLWATCSVYDSSLPHQNDGYNTDTRVTLQVETSYYTGCTATHQIQVQQEPTHAYINADKHIRSKALLYGGPTVRCQSKILAQQYSACLHAFVRKSADSRQLYEHRVK